MKTIVAAAFTVASLIAAPIPAFASNAAAMACGESVPEEWKRPGGYCDQIGGSGSLSTPSTTDSIVCPVVAGLIDTNRMLLAAVPVDACGNPIGGCVVAPEQFLMPADRGRLLLIAC